MALVGPAALLLPAPRQGLALSDEAVAYQINPAHDGNQPGDALTTPLAQKWAVDLGGPVSYPLIAGGKVFVTVGNVAQPNAPNYGSSLVALDQQTGQLAWGPIKLGGSTYWSAATYENGRVFAIDAAGVLRAFDAGSGGLIWSRQLEDNRYIFDSAPTAFRGLVYVGGAGSQTTTDPGGTVWAVRENDGSIAWSTRVNNGMRSSPAAMATGIFVNYSCPQVYRLDPLTGAQAWHYAPSCQAGGGRTAVYFYSIVYARELFGKSTLVASDGGFSLGPFSAGPPPAFDGANEFLVGNGPYVLQSKDTVVGSAVKWTFAGDSQLSSGPVTANGTVYVGSSAGNLYGVDASSGQLKWTTNVGSPIARSDFEPYPNGPITGLGIGQGMLVVPASNRLVAYSSAGTVGAGGLNTTFYFAEGYTGPGFHEVLSLFMPNQSGKATIDCYTKSGHRTGSVNLSAGKVSTLDVNQALGPNQEVSIKVTLPWRGVVERIQHFNTGGWYGSTDKVGANEVATEWDFAEGSTLPQFSEYLTLQNPNGAPVAVDLNYMTDAPGLHPTKSLTLPPSSRTTVPVFMGDRNLNANCDAATSCGIGRGIAGVSLQVLAHGLPIVAERPFYVNGYSFGWGPIRDGHDEFGANQPQGQWEFAEGTTLAGFNEYLTLQNPTAIDNPAVDLDYYDNSGKATYKRVTVHARSRLTIPVFEATYGVGPNVAGVSVHIVSDQPIVAERPMYIDRDFGSGPVAGATDSKGSGLVQTVGFSALSTASGEYDYLTIFNEGSGPIRIDYYLGSGLVSREINPRSEERTTIAVFDPNQGVGRDQTMLGIIIEADHPIVAEKVTYSTNPTTYGATDTTGYSPPGSPPGSF
jgi:outer membrane protein assembly factor BamB